MIAVVPLELSHLNDVARIHVDTWHDTYTGIFPDEVLARMTMEKMLATWQTILSENPAQLLNIGAFHGDELLGICSAGKAREDWGYDAEIWMINIPKRFQKRGVGKALFEECLRFFKRSQVKNFYLYCLEVNQNALDFYQYLGGRVTTKNDWSHGAREVAVVWDTLPERF